MGCDSEQVEQPHPPVELGDEDSVSGLCIDDLHPLWGRQLGCVWVGEGRLELTGMAHLSENCGREEAPSIDRAPSIDAVRGRMGEDGRDCELRGEEGGARPLGGEDG